MKLYKIKEYLLQIIADAIDNESNDSNRNEIADVLNLITGKLQPYAIVIPGYVTTIHEDIFTSSIKGNFIRNATMELLLNIAHDGGDYEILVNNMVTAHLIVCLTPSSIIFDQHRIEFSEVNQTYIKELLMNNPWMYFVLITNMLIKQNTLKELFDKLNSLTSQS